VYRAVDQPGQVIDVYVSQRRDIGSSRTFFTAALAVHGDPVEVITDRAPALANAIEDLKTNRTASVVIRGHAVIQNLRRGHDELAVETAPLFRLASAFDELRPAI
jgi:IS6 family transposase